MPLEDQREKTIPCLLGFLRTPNIFWEDHHETSSVSSRISEYPKQLFKRPAGIFIAREDGSLTRSMLNLTMVKNNSFNRGIILVSIKTTYFYYHYITAATYSCSSRVSPLIIHFILGKKLYCRKLLLSKRNFLLICIPLNLS